MWKISPFRPGTTFSAVEVHGTVRERTQVGNPHRNRCSMCSRFRCVRCMQTVGKFFPFLHLNSLNHIKMWTRGSLSRIEMHVSYRIPGYRKFGTGSKMKPVLDTQPFLPYCDAVSQRDETNTIKPIINEAAVASSGA